MCLTNDKGAYTHLYIFANPFIEEIASKTSVQPTTLLLWTAISEVRPTGQTALTLRACETEQNKKRVPLLHAPATPPQPLTEPLAPSSVCLLYIAASRGRRWGGVQD